MPSSAAPTLEPPASMVSEYVNGIKRISEGLDSSTSKMILREKEELLSAAKQLVEKLEGPEIGIWKVVFGPQANAALRSAIEIRIFEVFEDNCESRNADQLARQTGAEKLLLVRVMRALTSVGIFTEVGEETYTHNLRSKIFTNTTFRTMMRGMSSIMTPYLVKLPEYLSSTSFQNPGTGEQSLFQYTMDTKMNYFDWLHTQPRDLEIFSAAMQASSQRSQGAAAKLVSSQFPLSDVLHSGTKVFEEIQEENVLIVDVGGGRGKVLNDLRMARPDLQGGMIVQDLPKEIDGREPTPGVRSMAHDFFTPQPIKGAHTYFFRHIFHDWPDNACIKILQQIIPAMKKGYSRILIVDLVLPDVGASVFGSLLDINMMPLSGIERTEKHWKKLLEGEGLKVVNIQWPATAGGSRDCVLEAVLE
ncbi:hypothetical protein EAE96_003525 [Botrytis aclada]|nr:hypothetical protein EAE96_003525 [Botrytis aclada]